ncbi:MAG TPA: UbiA family prenyltransferase, partial [Candidatus Andersenbacteria bacterium]|nr:UbiA family prenyltransferase [Candidatus Andersenbacteria bacterium]
TLEKPINATTKFQVLKERFGEKGFSYAGNSTSDISVWNISSSAIIVHAPTNVTTFVREHSIVEREFPTEKKLRIQDIVQEIRIHQWLKNLLLFVPPIMAHRIGNPETFFHTLVGFFSFSLLASSMYVMNDLLDIQADRAHQTKRFRPIALGTITALQAIILAVSVALGSFIFALSLLPLAFSAMLVLYIVINAVYSFRAKKIPYIDISILAGLYVLRIIAGSAATGITTSAWLFFFAGFFFFFLASMKRVIELLQLKQREDMAPGRGYSKRDTELLVALGMTSSLLACIVLGLYMRSESVTHLYTNPKMLWTLLPLLTIWIVRMWYLTLTKNMPDDPVLFTSKDIVSYGIGTAIVGVLILAGQ